MQHLLGRAKWDADQVRDDKTRRPAAPKVTNSRHLTGYKPSTPMNTPLTSRNSEVQLEY
jgi:hypothetical protein